jgi:dihydropteroate synthase
VVVGRGAPDRVSGARVLVAGEHRLPLGSPLVMGVLNVTPDSFSDGGRHAEPAAAEARALEMVAQGAMIIDVGGESTRPGASPVPADEEIRRVVPVIERIRARSPVLISIDTSEPRVIEAAVSAGASLVNDVRGLRRPGALSAAAQSGAAVCVMHMKGEPGTMQDDPRYADVVAEVGDYLEDRVAECLAVGIPRDSIVVDPGFGFGKTLEHHLEMMARLGEFAGLGCPLLVGLSRKSMLGVLTGRPVGERLYAGVAAAAIAVSRGADIVRAHDVAATLDAVRIGAAMRRPRE